MNEQINNIKNILSEFLSNQLNLNQYFYILSRSVDATSCSKYGLKILDGKNSNSYITELKTIYCGTEANENCVFKEYERIWEFDGSFLENTLYHTKITNESIKEVWDAINSADIKCEKKWLDVFQKSKNAKGFMVEGNFNDKPITLIMSSPLIKEIKHSFFMIDGKFKLVSGGLLTLPMRIDVIRIGDDVYFLTKQGQAICLSMKYLQENCERVVKEISNTNKISEIENFAKYASTYNNKRRLLRYKKEKFEFITQNNKKEAIEIRKKFGIEFKNNRIIIKSQTDADMLIKLVCDRGMLDPFNNDPIEVSGAQTWKIK